MTKGAIQHSGIVKEINEGHATVAFERSPVCDHCGACNKSENSDEMLYVINNSMNAAVGDHVIISVPSKEFITVSFYVYVVPLLLLIAGILIGGLFSELLSIFGGISLCASSFFILRALDKKSHEKHLLEPVMIRVDSYKE